MAPPHVGSGRPSCLRGKQPEAQRENQVHMEVVMERWHPFEQRACICVCVCVCVWWVGGGIGQVVRQPSGLDELVAK